MNDTQERFTMWFKKPLEGLYEDPNAGFVILIATLPLLERFLREKSGVGERDLNDDFFQ